MTRELLNQIAKAKKINLKDYDSIIGIVNDKYTFVHIWLGNAEVVGGTKKVYNQIQINLSVSAILKKENGIWPEDYETHGWQYLDYLR